MIGTVLRFKLKKTLIGIAALSLLVPVASHADVTKGRWIFDGFSRATRDGQGSTCVSSGGDTHAFAIEDCNGAASTAEAERKKVLEAKAAAKAAADAKKAAIKSEVAQTLPGGQQTGSVRRADGIRILDGFGRDCIRDGSIIAATGNCDAVAPAAPAVAATAAKPAAAPAPAPAPVVPGSALQSDQIGAYVQETGKAPIRDGFGRACIRDGLWNPATASEDCSPAVYEAFKAGPAAPAPKVAAPVPAPVAPGALVNGEPAAYVRESTGSAVRDGYGRSCIKDGRWQTGLATEECDPDLFNQWRAKTAAEQTAAPAVQAAAPAPAAAQPATVWPEANGPSQPDPGPGIAPAPDKAAVSTGPVIDNTLPVFPVTTYAFTPDVEPTEPLPAVSELAAAEVEDEVDDSVAQAEDVEEEEMAALADTGPAQAGEDEDTMLAAEEDAPAAPTDGSPLHDDGAVMPFIADARSDDDEDEVEDTVATEDGADDETAYLGDGPLPEEIPEAVATPVEDETDETYDTVADGDAWDDETAYLGDGPLDEGIPEAVATPVEDEIDDTPSTDVAAWDDESAYLGDGDLPEAAPVVATAPPAQSAAPVANAECPPTTIQVEEDGRFAFDRYVLRADVIAKLDSIADLLKTAKCEGIHIAGHTDRIGSLKYNQTLSERRATAARNYLVNKKGVDASLITTSGHGETQPVTKPEQCAGKRHKALIKCYAPDRRVFITATLRKRAN